MIQRPQTSSPSLGKKPTTGPGKGPSKRDEAAVGHSSTFPSSKGACFGQKIPAWELGFGGLPGRRAGVPLAWACYLPCMHAALSVVPDSVRPYGL